MNKYEDAFKESLKSADPEVQDMFPEVLKEEEIEKHDIVVKFRTRYNCHIDDCEHPDPVSVVEPGRAESLDHLVQRLTGKSNPTARDLSYLAIKSGVGDFEDPTKLTPEEIDERMERVVTLGDKIDAEDALAAAVTDFSNARVSELADAKEEDVRTTTTRSAGSETVPGVSGQGKADASAS